jgi:hypothetical protein
MQYLRFLKKRWGRSVYFFVHSYYIPIFVYTRKRGELFAFHSKSALLYTLRLIGAEHCKCWRVHRNHIFPGLSLSTSLVHSLWTPCLVYLRFLQLYSPCSIPERPHLLHILVPIPKAKTTETGTLLENYTSRKYNFIIVGIFTLFILKTSVRHMKACEIFHTIWCLLPENF